MSGKQHVQLLLQGRTVCATLVGKKVHNERKYFSVRLVEVDLEKIVPQAHVRPCSGVDGRCVCAGETMPN